MLNNSGNRLEDAFFEKYQISLLTETDSKANPWNLSQELQKLNQYNKQIHVYYNPDTGSSTRDNEKGVITVSFIAMLMDGTRDGVRPQLSVVADHSITSDNDYIVIRDGNKDDRWEMTFFIAPTGYNDNPATTSNVSAGTSSTSSSGSGCGTVRPEIFAGILLLVLCLPFVKRERS